MRLDNTLTKFANDPRVRAALPGHEGESPVTSPFVEWQPSPRFRAITEQLPAGGVPGGVRREWYRNRKPMSDFFPQPAHRETWTSDSSRILAGGDDHLGPKTVEAPNIQKPTYVDDSYWDSGNFAGRMLNNIFGAGEDRALSTYYQNRPPMGPPHRELIPSLRGAARSVAGLVNRGFFPSVPSSETLESWAKLPFALGSKLPFGFGRAISNIGADSAMSYNRGLSEQRANERIENEEKIKNWQEETSQYADLKKDYFEAVKKRNLEKTQQDIEEAGKFRMSDFGHHLGQGLKGLLPLLRLPTQYKGQNLTTKK